MKKNNQTGLTVNQLIKKFDQHGDFIDICEIAEAFTQDKHKSLFILIEFLEEQDNKNYLMELKLNDALKRLEQADKAFNDAMIDLQHYKKISTDNHPF